MAIFQNHEIFWKKMTFYECVDNFWLFDRLPSSKTRWSRCIWSWGTFGPIPFTSGHRDYLWSTARTFSKLKTTNFVLVFANDCFEKSTNFVIKFWNDQSMSMYAIVQCYILENSFDISHLVITCLDLKIRLLPGQLFAAGDMGVINCWWWFAQFSVDE